MRSPRLERPSIRRHLLYLVVFVTVPFAMFEAWASYSVWQAEIEEANMMAYHLALDTARDTQTFIAAAKKAAERLAQREAIRSLDPSRCDPILRDFVEVEPQFANASTLDLEGNIICSGAPLAAGPRHRVDPVHFLKRLQETGEPTVGNPAKGIITGKWIVTIAHPLREATGRLVGAIALSVDLLKFSIVPNLGRLSPNAGSGILAGNGIVMAHSGDPEKFVGTSVEGREISRAMLRDRSGVREELGLDSRLRIHGFTPIQGTDWIAIGSIPADEVYAPARARIATSVLLAAGIATLALLLVIRWSRAIRDPVLALSDAARLVAQGDLTARAPVSGPVEIADVAEQFNRMLNARTRTEAELHEAERRFRDVLSGIELVAVILDPDGRVVYFNEFLVRLTGWRHEEIFGVSWFDHFVPRDPGIPRIIFMRAIQTAGLPSHYENEILTRTGERRLIRWSNTVLRSTDGATVGTASIGEDVTEQRRAETALRESKTVLQTVTRRLLDVQENERRSIACELHDEVGGALTAIKLNLQSLRAKDPGHGDGALNDGLALVDGAIQSVRSLSLDLRPSVLDDMGLVPALQWYSRRQALRSGIPIHSTLEAIDLKRAPQLESACFRIVQGSVTNALRHANASNIRIALRLDECGFEIEVEDDGTGFDVAVARRLSIEGESSGLLGMEERASLLGGLFSVDSRHGAGTRVRARFAMPSEEAA